MQAVDLRIWDPEEYLWFGFGLGVGEGSLSLLG